MALKIDEVVAELRDLGFDPVKVAEAEKALRKLEEDKKEERDEVKEPKAKNEFVIIVSDPNNSLPKDLTGWVVQIPEGEDTTTTLDRIRRSAQKQNTTMKKFIKAPLKSFGDAMQNIKRKFSKVEKVLIKTANPVVVLTTDNKL